MKLSQKLVLAPVLIATLVAIKYIYLGYKRRTGCGKIQVALTRLCSPVGSNEDPSTCRGGISAVQGSMSQTVSCPGGGAGPPTPRDARRPFEGAGGGFFLLHPLRQRRGG